MLVFYLFDFFLKLGLSLFLRSLDSTCSNTLVKSFRIWLYHPIDLYTEF